jgi:Protein of unknown function (DUF3460)
MYESDLTKFIRQFLAEHPEELESQKQGRAIWWDKKPGERAPVPPMRHAPKAGGNEYTFEPLDEAETEPVDRLPESKVDL